MNTPLPIEVIPECVPLPPEFRDASSTATTLKEWLSSLNEEISQRKGAAPDAFFTEEEFKAARRLERPLARDLKRFSDFALFREVLVQHIYRSNQCIESCRTDEWRPEREILTCPEPAEIPPLPPKKNTGGRPGAIPSFLNPPPSSQRGRYKPPTQRTLQLTNLERPRRMPGSLIQELPDEYEPDGTLSGSDRPMEDLEQKLDEPSQFAERVISTALHQTQGRGIRGRTINVVFTVDYSGSMVSSLALVMRSIAQIISGLKAQGASIVRMGLISFVEKKGIKVELPLAEMDERNLKKLFRKLGEMTDEKTGGGILCCSSGEAEEAVGEAAFRALEMVSSRGDDLSQIFVFTDTDGLRDDRRHPPTIEDAVSSGVRDGVPVILEKSSRREAFLKGEQISAIWGDTRLDLDGLRRLAFLNLDDSSEAPWVRFEAALALATVREAEGLKALSAFIDACPDERFKLEAARALVKLKGSEATQHLVRLATSALDEWLKLKAADTLYDQQRDLGLPFYRQLAYLSSDENVRAEAIVRLARAGVPEWAAALQTLENDESLKHRALFYGAVETLAHDRGRALELFRQLLPEAHKNDWLGVRVGIELAGLGDPEGLPLLRKLAGNSKYGDRRLEAAKALFSAEPETTALEALTDLVLGENYDATLRLKALDFILQKSPADGVPLLHSLILQADLDWLAIAAAERLADKGDPLPLASLILDNPEAIREFVAIHPRGVLVEASQIRREALLIDSRRERVIRLEMALMISRFGIRDPIQITQAARRLTDHAKKSKDAAFTISSLASLSPLAKDLDELFYRYGPIVQELEEELSDRERREMVRILVRYAKEEKDFVKLVAYKDYLLAHRDQWLVRIGGEIFGRTDRLQTKSRDSYYFVDKGLVEGEAELSQAVLVAPFEDAWLYMEYAVSGESYHKRWFKIGYNEESGKVAYKLGFLKPVIQSPLVRIDHMAICHSHPLAVRRLEEAVGGSPVSPGDVYQSVLTTAKLRQMGYKGTLDFRVVTAAGEYVLRPTEEAGAGESDPLTSPSLQAAAGYEEWLEGRKDKITFERDAVYGIHLHAGRFLNVSYTDHPTLRELQPRFEQLVRMSTGYFPEGQGANLNRARALSLWRNLTTHAQSLDNAIKRGEVLGAPQVLLDFYSKRLAAEWAYLEENFHPKGRIPPSKDHR